MLCYNVSMKQDVLDRGLLYVFRLFIGIRLLGAILGLLAQVELAGRRLQIPEPTIWLTIVETVLLLVYLSWPWLRRRMGKAYLPLALAVAMVAPVVENFLSLRYTSNLLLAATGRILIGQWQLVIILLVPVILLSWQYGLLPAVWTSLGLAVLDAALIAVSPTALPFYSHPLPLIGVILFRTMVFLLISFVIVRLSRELRQRNTRLEQANQQLASYAADMERLTISRERNRLARELHDTLAHSLSAVAVQLEAVNALWDKDPRQARAMLEHSLSITRDGLNEARRAIQSLRTAPLDDLGLVLALQNLATSTAERENLTLDLEIAQKLPAISPDREYAIYRITEESLRNIAQHSGAKNLSMSLKRVDHSLALTIQDDGCGFDASQATPDDRFGLRGMRERAQASGASFEVVSHPGQGTTIRLVMEDLNDQSTDL